jgi:hypothetical protein
MFCSAFLILFASTAPEPFEVGPDEPRSRPAKGSRRKNLTRPSKEKKMRREERVYLKEIA